jgi:hypothetical protein
MLVSIAARPLVPYMVESTAWRSLGVGSLGLP